MRAVILGGTGFIGQSLTSSLAQYGWQVTVTSRSPEKGRFLIPEGHSPNLAFVQWDGIDPAPLVKHLEDSDAVINLIGSNIGAGKWTDERKSLILSSRVDAGLALTEALTATENKPSVLVQASAVGYYGGSKHMGTPSAFSEKAPHGKGFLAHVASQWEASTEAVESMGIRRVIIRTGVVLGHDGGALKKFLTPFKFFAGGPLGSGEQGFCWIHKADEVGAINHLIANVHCRGAYNLTAPHPVSMKEFCDELAAQLNRPSWLPAPSAALKLFLGEMAEELILQGQNALPEKLIKSGYQFRYPRLNLALTDIVAHL